MSESQPKDTVALALFAIGVIASVVELVYRPFLVGPLALLVLMVGALLSGKHRRLSMGAAFLIATCFVIGAGYAVWDSQPLY